MKKVRILKDGEYKGVEYKVGEIWDLSEEYQEFKFSYHITKDDKQSLVSVSEEDHKYGKEAEIIEEAELINQIEFIL